jgi:hypothetical protein
MSRRDRTKRTKPRLDPGYEKDAHRIAQRIKQINIGKSSEAYAEYLAHVPVDLRILGVHPTTPRPELKWTKKGFDDEVADWKAAVWAMHNQGKMVVDDDGGEEYFVPSQVGGKICIQCGKEATEMCNVCQYAVCSAACFNGHFF